jgi:predicted nucleic acid-binding Zn ribbon protein
LIAVISPRGTSFKYLLRYLEFGRDGKQRGRAAWMEFHNLATRNPELAACFMAATAAGSVSGTKKPVYHFCVSFDIDDPVDEAIMRQVAERTRRDMGLLEYQCVVVAHQDRSHLHLHFVVNRVHPERRTLWRDWQDYYRLERSLRAQEVELGLRIVPGWNAPVPSLVPGRDGMERHPQDAPWIKPRSGPRRGDDAFLQDVTVRAAPVLQRARSWAEIERGLAEEGLTLRSKGGGFIITDGKHLVKASDVGRGCSRYHLEKRLGRWPDYRARMAVASMARSKPVVQPAAAAHQLATSAPAVDALASAPKQDAPTKVHERDPQARARGDRRPQFGDAGYGMAELFGYTQPREREDADAVEKHVTAPQPSLVQPSEPSLAMPAGAGLSGDALVEKEPFRESVPEPAAEEPQAQPIAPRLAVPVEPPPPALRKRRQVEFLKEVKERATTVLERAGSWAKLERGLADLGLSLCVKGGGFTVTDGELEVKASDVGRAFSRFHLEKRLGWYPDSPAGIAAPETLPALPTPAVQLDALAAEPEAPIPPLPASATREPSVRTQMPAAPVPAQPREEPAHPLRARPVRSLSR